MDPMSDREFARFMSGEMTQEEEDALLKRRPELQDFIDLSVMVDGEASPETVERLHRRLAESPKLRAYLSEFLEMNDWTEAARTGTVPSPSRPGMPSPKPKRRPAVKGGDKRQPRGGIRAGALAASLVATIGGGSLLYADFRSADERAREYIATAKAARPDEPRWSFSDPSGEARTALPTGALRTLSFWGQSAIVAAAYAYAGQTERAEEAATGLGKTADDLSDRAALALVLNQPARARALMIDAIHRQPEHAAAHWNLAVAEQRLGHRKAAIEALAWTTANDEEAWQRRASQLKRQFGRPLMAMVRRDAQRAEHRQRAIRGGLGDIVELTVWTDRSTHVALRVYFNETQLVAECPSTACRRVGDSLRVSVSLDRRGRYDAIALASEHPVGSPRASLAADLGAHLTKAYRLEPIEVR